MRGIGEVSSAAMSPTPDIVLFFQELDVARVVGLAALFE